MGTNVTHTDFNAADYRRFDTQLRTDLSALEELLKRPDFARGPASLGAELELSLVDHQGNAKWINEELLALANDPQLTLELNRYNLEYNLSPVPAQGKPFSSIASEIRAKLLGLQALAASLDARPVPIGILPTVTKADISRAAMTESKRYQVLTERITKMRGSPFEISIAGADPLFLTLRDLNAEGANTSFQIHLRVNPGDFVNVFNASQLILAPALAIATNSPVFLQHRLWEETRIPLFKQAVETRTLQERKQGCTSRTGMGKGWISESALEVFSRSVNEFKVIFPECDHEDSTGIVTGGGIPQLAALRLHHGSIWHWNRAIYDPAAGGHLRIEMRGLPSGPTPVDMAANAAFLIGCVLGIASKMPNITELMPYPLAKFNCYRAAQSGMSANILWPNAAADELVKIPASQVIQELLPYAQAGLSSIKVDPGEIRQHLDIVDHRLTAQITGARWQLQRLEQLESDTNRNEALHKMLNEYVTRAAEGSPVHQWSH